MLHPVTFAEAYNRVRDKLSRGERMRLAVIEHEIMESPELGPGRFEARGYYYDSTFPDFLIAYRLNEGRVVFELLLDLGDSDPGNP